MQSTELTTPVMPGLVLACPGHDEKRISQTQLRDLAAPCARALQKSSAPRGRGECRVPAAPADGVTAPPGAFQASRASYGAVCGARRAACLAGRRSSLTLVGWRRRGQASLQASRRDDHGSLCRNRRVIGMLKHVRCRRDMRPRLGPPRSRRIAYAMLLGEGLAAHRAEFGLGRVNKTDVIGFPQHAFDLAVTIVRCESSSRVAKSIASIRVGAIGKQLFHNINVTAIRGPHQRRTVDDVPGVAVSVMGKQNFDRY